MRATVNATPLIYLAKADSLNLLETLLEEFYVARPVWVEVVEVGSEHGYRDAELIRGFMAGRIKDVDDAEARKLADRFNLGLGEASTLILARELACTHVIVDDAAAVKVAKILGLIPVSTPFLLLKSLKRGTIDTDSFHHTFRRILKEGYYLSPSLVEEVLRRARGHRTGP